MNTQPEAFVSVPSFADRTSLSVRTVWDLVASGEIPSIRVRRRRLIPLQRALKALAEVDPNPESGAGQ